MELVLEFIKLTREDVYGNDYSVVRVVFVLKVLYELK